MIAKQFLDGVQECIVAKLWQSIFPTYRTSTPHAPQIQSIHLLLIKMSPIIIDILMLYMEHYDGPHRVIQVNMVS